MTIYVSELPKSCEECPLRNYMCDSYWCSAYKGDTILFADEVKEANLCPLQSLSDYTKQVRKEVCEEIRQNAISHNNLEVDMYYITPQQLYEIEQGETK